MKVSIFSFLIFIGLAFSSCLKDNDALADDSLIAQIQAATNKQDIDSANLPASSLNILNEDFSESFLENIVLAEGLGYEVQVQREMGAFMGERSHVYFNLEGRELRPGRFGGPRGRGQGGCDREECFQVLFPVTFVMPDESTVTGDSRQEVGMAIRAWYEANPDAEDRPELQFPIEIEFEDGTVQSIESYEDLRTAYQDCF